MFAIQAAFWRAGYDVHKIRDPVADAAPHIATDAPTLFDVGANAGQSALAMLAHFPKANIHCFEPSPTTFKRLNQAVGMWATLNQCAVGSEPGMMTLNENEISELTSLLPLGSDGYGKVEHNVLVPVTTIDSYCVQNSISEIDLLKVDAQGYDHQVLVGAERMLSKIRAILTELTFDDLYEGKTRYDLTLTLLADRGFKLVGVYHPNRGANDGLTSYADFLLVRQKTLLDR
jgi:FkbM family methyltransferase